MQKRMGGCQGRAGRRLLPVLMALLAGAAWAGVVSAEAGLVGHWEGFIEIPGTKLEIDLDF